MFELSTGVSAWETFPCEAFELGWGGQTEAKLFRQRVFLIIYEKLKMHGVRRTSCKMQIFNLNIFKNWEPNERSQLIAWKQRFSHQTAFTYFSWKISKVHHFLVKLQFICCNNCCCWKQSNFIFILLHKIIIIVYFYGNSNNRKRHINHSQNVWNAAWKTWKT